MRPLILYFLMFPLVNNAQSALRDCFVNDSITELHVYPSKYWLSEFPQDSTDTQLEFSGKKIPNHLIKDSLELEQDFHGAEFFGQITSSLGNSLFASIVFVKENQVNACSVIILIHQGDYKIKSMLFPCKYECLLGSYEMINNFWIEDIDSDGDLDIIVKMGLNDFELPNEFSENISNTACYFYENLNGTLLKKSCQILQEKEQLKCHTLLK